MGVWVWIYAAYIIHSHALIPSDGMFCYAMLC